MKPIFSRVVLLAAAGVLVVGGAYAGQLYTSPPKYTGPNTQQILATSQRLQGELPKAPDAESIAAEARAAAAAAARRRVLKDLARVSAPQSRRVAKTPAPARTTPVASPTPAPLPSAPAPAPGSDLALTGIGGARSDREAMVFHLVDRKRESGKRGDTVFGFTLVDIRDDSIDLRQGSTLFTLRLGEKSAVVSAALATPAASTTAVIAASNPSTTGATNAGMNRTGGRGGDWRAWMAANAAQANANTPGNRGNGNWNGNRGRNNNRRRNSTTLSGARRYSDGPNASRRYSTVSSASAQNARMGGFRGGFGFGGFGGRGRRGQGDQTVLEPTSNPQEARRTGAPLLGEVEAMFEPEAFSNPQTERRTGSTSGQAFGDSAYNNRGFNNERGGFGRSGFGNRGRPGGGRTTGMRTGTTRG